jgi:copper/silver efflux system protein
VEAVRRGNMEASGRIIEHAGSEYLIRGSGYAHSLADLEDIVLSGPERTSPVRVKDVGQVTLGPEARRGAAELDGKGEAVSGIVILRPGTNTEAAIRRVKQKIETLKNALPQGVRVVPIYDRSVLIERSIANMRATLIEVVLMVIIVIWIFLWDIPSSLIPAITVPSTVLFACLSLHALGMTAKHYVLGWNRNRGRRTCRCRDRSGRADSQTA